MANRAQDALQLVNNPQRADIIIKLGEDQNEVFAHSQILFAHSPYFRTMFSSGLYEGKDGNASPGKPIEIEMPDIEKDVFLAALEWWYTGKIRQESLNADNSIGLLELANKHQD